MRQPPPRSFPAALSLSTEPSSMSDDGSQAGSEVELDLSNSDVVTKYKAAADICNKAIASVIDACKDGALVVDLCKLGDDSIIEAAKGIFKGKAIDKGVAFPTCVSINNVVGHYSPTSEDTTALKAGDLIKVDLGAHIDGFIATQAQTLVVGTSNAAPIEGRAADAIQAARTAFEAALRLIRPGKRVADVADKLAAVVEPFGCQLVEGVMSHQMKQFVIDGNKVVLNRPSPEHRVDDAEFEANEVYAIDIVVSTGEGKPKLKDEKETTVYKRAAEVEYKLKLKASRAVFSEITKRPVVPFTIRALTDEGEAEKNKELQKQLRLGLVECLNHGLLHPYPVLHEKAGELVAQVKATVLLMPNGSDRITLAPSQEVKSDKSVTDPELLTLLSSSVKSKPNKKKNKKKAAKEGDAPAADTAAEAEA